MNKNDCLQGNMSDCVNTLVEEHGICESYWMDGNLTYLDSGTDYHRSSDRGRTSNLDNWILYSISSKWLTIIHETNDSFCRKRVTKKFQKFFKKMESEEMREGHLSWYLYLNLFKDPVCKCAQKLSQVSFGCTFLFGSTVVMINLIMFVHLRNVYSEIYSER